MKYCHICKQEIDLDHSPYTGYGEDDNGNPICYACCATVDMQHMKDHGKITLYLQHNDLTDQNELGRPEWEIINWPGTLRIHATVKTTQSNRAIWGIRHDVWFVGPDGKQWYGRHQGDYNDLVHCKRLKA